MASDSEIMEASLVAVAEAGIEIRHRLFERFFAAFPERERDFLVPEASSIRMTDETVQMMYGLACGESWVWPLVAELVDTHRNFGDLPIGEFEAFVAMTVEGLAEAAGDAWSAECEAAWRRQAERLLELIARAKAEWAAVMPHAGDPPG